MQVLDWRLPMGAGQYQEYADAIFCAAADALLAPPMQAPQVLSPWLSPVESTVLVDGLPMWQGALRLAPQTSATDVALAAVSNAEIPSAPTLKVALAATLAFEAGRALGDGPDGMRQARHGGGGGEGALCRGRPSARRARTRPWRQVAPVRSE